MITTGAVDGDLIEQFKDDIAAFDVVESVTSKPGQREVSVKVSKTDDGVPHPHRELGDVEDGYVKCEKYVIGLLGGSGHSPGDHYVHKLSVSPYCPECWDAPQKGLDEDDPRCRDCSRHDNLLKAKPGVTVLVEAGDDNYGVRAEPGDVIEATADEDGLVRGPDGVFNDGRFQIIGRVQGDDDE